MKIIISPAKQMKTCDIYDFELSKPIFIKKSKELLSVIQTYSINELQTVLRCSNKIAHEAWNMFASMNLDKSGSPSLMTYQGIQYKYMAPGVLEDDALYYLFNNLYILSGFYGLLRPNDGIVPYRLEMQTNLSFSLYDFWKDQIAKAITDPILLNLASEEYAKCIRPYRPMIDVRFYENVNGHFIEKGVYVKMARGEMVRFLATHQIHNLEDIKSFNESGYQYNDKLSTKNEIVFVRNAIPKKRKP